MIPTLYLEPPHNRIYTIYVHISAPRLPLATARQQNSYLVSCLWLYLLVTCFLKQFRNFSFSPFVLTRLLLLAFHAVRNIITQILKISSVGCEACVSSCLYYHTSLTRDTVILALFHILLKTGSYKTLLQLFHSQLFFVVCPKLSIWRLLSYISLSDV